MDTAHGIADLTSFVGRQNELAEVKRLVGASRLVTVTGAGGTGKSRLALRVAAELRRMFPDGVRQADLAELTDGCLVEYAVVRALAISRGDEPTVSRLLAEHLADRELLLVLDNCEHVLDACAALVDKLLRAAPGLSVLCTSQQPLGMVGETVRTLAPLAVPPETPGEGEDLTRYPSLTLFAERAAAVVPGFALTPDNAALVAAICRRLDGLPLAIELAAAQLRARSLEQVAAGLNERFRLLSSRHAAPARHARLRDALDWSYALCSPAEQALWACLSVFAGFDLDGATAVCAGDDLPAEDLLDAIVGLVDKSILVREDLVAGPRYRLLESLREYGLDRLAEPDRTRLRRRHRDWYLRLAERLDAEWFGGAQPWWAAVIRAEYANLRTALGWSFATPGEAAAGVRLAAALRWYWICGGELVDGRYWLRLALDADPGPSPARAGALRAYLQILVAQAAGDETPARAEEFLTLARQLDDPLLIAQATHLRGVNELRCGPDLPKAVALLEEARERHAALGGRDPEGQAMIQLSLALARLSQRDTDRAAGLCAECRRFCEDRGELWWRSYTLVACAMIALARGEPVEATGYLHESLRLRDALGDVLGLAQSFNVLADAAAVEGYATRAARLRGAAERAWRSTGVTVTGSGYHRARGRETAARLHSQLGEEPFATAVQDGARLTLQQALTYALEGDAPPASPPVQPSDGSPLTPRERQVARLIADGLSNRQIAARLVISQRTAESHVENILAKLGFTSRTQVAAWAARRPLK